MVGLGQWRRWAGLGRGGQGSDLPRVAISPSTSQIWFSLAVFWPVSSAPGEDGCFVGDWDMDLIRILLGSDLAWLASSSYLCFPLAVLWRWRDTLCGFVALGYGPGTFLSRFYFLQPRLWISPLLGMLPLFPVSIMYHSGSDFGWSG